MIQSKGSTLASQMWCLFPSQLVPTSHRKPYCCGSETQLTISHTSNPILACPRWNLGSMVRNQWVITYLKKLRYSWGWKKNDPITIDPITSVPGHPSSWPSSGGVELPSYQAPTGSGQEFFIAENLCDQKNWHLGSHPSECFYWDDTLFFPLQKTTIPNCEGLLLAFFSNFS